jgi:hypothetical protein
MTVTRGREHDFLGMKFVLNNNQTVSISMQSYLEEAITESNLHVDRTAANPARKDLFEIREDSALLPKKEVETFHNVVAKLLYVSMRGRLDIMLAISFLCTRDSKPTSQDQDKLLRLLQNLKGTLTMQLTLGADNLNTLNTWVDASYTVHSDMKSHTGGVISMGLGAVLCKSTKQKLNTKSSTEAELVGATDYLPNTIWSKKFLQSQGYAITTNIFHQDNVSAIRLEKNGRASAGKQSRHIDIRFFFMKDRIAEDKIDIRHCPTEAMLADFLMKPLQGNLFRRFRYVLLGYRRINQLHIVKLCTSSSEERVGKNEYEAAKKKVEVQNSEVHSTYRKEVEKDENGTEDTSGGTWSLVVSRKVEKDAKKKVAFTEDRST